MVLKEYVVDVEGGIGSRPAMFLLVDFLGTPAVKEAFSKASEG